MIVWQLCIIKQQFQTLLGQAPFSQTVWKKKNMQELLEEKFMGCKPSCGHKAQDSQGLCHPSTLVPTPSPRGGGWGTGSEHEA